MGSNFRNFPERLQFTFLTTLAFSAVVIRSELMKLFVGFVLYNALQQMYYMHTAAVGVLLWTWSQVSYGCTSKMATNQNGQDQNIHIQNGQKSYQNSHIVKVVK